MKKFYVLLLIALTSYLSAEHYGLKPLTDEHKEFLKHFSPKVTEVRPNKIGAHRLQKCGNKKCRATLDKEITFDFVGEAHQPLAAPVLPRSVNNSTLPSFPPIGDQQNLGSCVAWSTTYYQTSHEIGLANGYNNKTGNAHVFSPKWTYNLLNDGFDEGLYPMDAYDLMAKNGAPSISAFPYDSNYLAWDLRQQDWIDALSARTTPYQLVSGAASSPQNLTNIKQLLVNGHVLSFCTYVNSWVYTNVKADPSALSNPHTGELACSWMNGYSGGHCITIVGYDDDVWIDVNGNGVVDPGEKGAFLVANSWGTGWGNAGFVWVAYDAFLPVSAVRNGPNRNRVAVGDALDNYFTSILPKAVGYSPKLIALFSLSQAQRNQIWTGLGTSATAQTAPANTFASGALINQGGSFGFNGQRSSTTQTGSFALDFTDLLATISSTVGSQRFYLLLQDNKSGNPTNLSAYTLKDLVRNQSTNCSGLPLVCDGRKITPYIDYNLNAGPAPDTTPPVISITSPVDGAVVSGDFFVTVNASDNQAVARVEFYVDNVLKTTDTTAPYLFDLDTTLLSEGNHNLKVIAYDAASNQSQSSVSIVVDNVPAPTPPTPPTPPPVNALLIDCGGPGDQGYTASTTIKLAYTALPVIYQTARSGNFSYTFTVANGNYNVKLKFAELQLTRSGKRLFNVALNGNSVLANLDVFVAAGGFGKPHDRTFPVTVTNGKIVLNFVPTVGAAFVSGIEITR